MAFSYEGAELMGGICPSALYCLYGLILTAAVSFSCYPLMDAPVARWVVAFAALGCVAVRIYKTRSIFLGAV